MRRLPKCLLLWLLLGATAAAHDERVSSSDVVVDGDRVTWTLDVGLSGLQSVVELPADLIGARAEDLEPYAEAIARRLAGYLTLAADGAPLTLVPGAMAPVFEKMPGGEPVIDRVRQTFTAQAAAPISVLSIGVHLFSDLTSEHRALVTVRFAGREEQYTLLGPSELRVTSTPGSSWWQFVAWGVEHILTGYDHIAFLLALVLGAQRLRDLVVLVTAFTVAHSITLLLSALDVIRLPSQMTETLIAASIVYVAAENLWAKQPHHRWMLTFGFGLIHGLGFSSVLRGLLANQNAVLLPVVSFNIGVELGQLGLLSVVYPCLLWLRSAPDPERAQRRQRQVVVIGSSLVLLAGSGWLVERLFHLEFMPL